MRDITFDPSIPLALWMPMALAAGVLLGWYGVVARRRLPRRWWPGVMALMTIAVAVPLGILLNPTWLERIPPPEGKPLLTILVDRSASMATPDAEDGQTRYVSASRLASETAARLAEAYEIRVRWFADGSSLAAPDELSRREPDGAVTDLAAAIEEGLDDQRPQGQALLLLSDGIHNAAGGMGPVRQSVARAKALAAPVYAKTIGGRTGVRDLSVALDRPRELAFVDQRVPVVVRLDQRGSLARQTKLTIRLSDELVEEGQVELTPDGAAEETFDLKQPASGLYRYEIRAEPLSGEVTDVNNHATLVLRVVDEPVRVLLLEGKPYWDTKFLIRTLSLDPSIELTSVVKLAEGRLLERKVSRAAPRADSGGSDNQKPSEPEPGEQPERQLRTDQWTLRKDAGAILSDPEILASYQIVVLGRDAEAFLTDDALLALEKWLKQQECSVVCFRGPPASQINQRLGQLMPVRWTPSRPSRFRVRLTPSGQSLRWLPLGAGDAAGLGALPPLAAVARPQPRQVAQTLAESVSGPAGQSEPVITYVRVGMGRVVVVEGAGMWRWAFLAPQYQAHDKTYGLLWRSLTRWLVADVQLLPSQRLALKAEKVTFSTTETAAAALLVREEHLSQKIPEVELTGTALERPRLVTPVPSGAFPGEFRVAFGQLPEGQYRARVAGAAEDEIGAVTAFDVRRGNLQELLEVEARPDQMKFIAEQSGGALLADTDPGLLARQFDEHLTRTRPVRTAQTTAWDRWWVLLAAFCVWGGAWGLRRFSGLV